MLEGKHHAPNRESGTTSVAITKALDQDPLPAITFIVVVPSLKGAPTH